MPPNGAPNPLNPETNLEWFVNPKGISIQGVTAFGDSF